MTHVDASNFALKSNLASLKTEADKLDIDKLAPVPVVKTTYDTDKSDLEKNISDTDKKNF